MGWYGQVLTAFLIRQVLTAFDVDFPCSAADLDLQAFL